MNQFKLDLKNLKSLKKVKIVKNLKSGRHCKVKVIRLNNNLYVLKLGSYGKKLNLLQTKELVDLLKKYYNLIKKSKVNLPKLYFSIPIKEKKQNNSYFVLIVEEFIDGPNFIQLLKKSSDKKAIYFYKKLLVEAFKIINYKSKNSNKTSLFADIKPENFVINKKNEIYFVDFYPPKIKDKSLKMYPYYKRLHNRSYSYLVKRFSYKKTIFHILLADSICAKPKLKKEFENITYTFLESKKEFGIKNYLKKISKINYDVNNMLKKEQIEVLIKAKS